MANKKFYPKTKPGDMQGLHTDGGGYIFTDDVKAIIGPTNDDVIESLNQQNFNGTVDGTPNETAGIWIYSENANNLENKINIASNNISSIIDNNPNKTIVNPPAPASLPIKAILIGDSLSASIKDNSKKLQPLTKEGVLWKVGIALNTLNKFVSNYPVDNTITHVFITIGTNDRYSETSNIPNFINLLKTKFPNASKSIYIIKGLYGYSGIVDGGKDYYGKTIVNVKERLSSYYKKWTDLGVIALTNEVGSVTKHPGSSTPSIKAIGKEIDGILSGAPDVSPSTTQPSKPLSKDDDDVIVYTIDRNTYNIDNQEDTDITNNDGTIENSSSPLIPGLPVQPAGNPISSDDGTFQFNFDELPDREDEVVLFNLARNFYLEEPSDTDFKDLNGNVVIDITGETRISTGQNFTSNIGLVGGGGGGGNNFGSRSTYVLSKSKKFISPQDDEALAAIRSIKEGSNNILECAFKCNPKNYPGTDAELPNNKIPRSRNCKDGGHILLDIIGKTYGLTGWGMGCGEKSVWCAAGASFPWQVFNQTEEDWKEGRVNGGGFPITRSSNFVGACDGITKTWAKYPSMRFTKGVDFTGGKGKGECDAGSQLTDAGIEKFKQLMTFKGCVGNTRNPNSCTAGGGGHVFTPIYAELEGRVGYYYCLDFNWGGRTVNFVKRYIGIGHFGAYSGYCSGGPYFGDTSAFTGGSWAPNGIGTDYGISAFGITSIKEFLKSFLG